MRFPNSLRMGLKKLGFKVQKTVAYFYPDHKFGIERIKVKVVSRECELFIEVWIPWGRFARCPERRQHKCSRTQNSHGQKPLRSQCTPYPCLVHWSSWFGYFAGRVAAEALSMSHDVTFDEFMKRFVSSNTNGQVGDEGRLHRLFKKFIREWIGR